MSSDTARPATVVPKNKDKSVPWYTPDLKIPDDARRFLVAYAGVASDQVEAHVHKVRDDAWDAAPYPCLGNGRFLELGITKHFEYDNILRSVQSERGRFIDVGCCLGQDLRYLVAENCPPENIFGMELNPTLVDAGYDMFLDRAKLKSKIFVADLFDESNSTFNELKGTLDIAWVGSFLHLFGWEGQIKAAKRIVELLKDQKGVLVVGRQVGAIVPELIHRDHVSGSMYKHNQESFQKMWDEIGEVTGTKWDVDGYLEEVEGSVGFDANGKWGDVDGRRFIFKVLRVD